jgi:hypothetical protein
MNATTTKADDVSKRLAIRLGRDNTGKMRFCICWRDSGEVLLMCRSYRTARGILTEKSSCKSA